MKLKTKQIAIGGITAALTFVLCFLGSVSVAGRLIAPGICGLMLIPVDRYVSRPTAAAVYATSALVLFLLPERMSAFAYLLLLGYYPLLSGALRACPMLVQILLKIAILTAVGCIALFAGAAILGLWENPQFVRWYPALILAYYVMAGIYDVFIIALRYQMENRWDEKLRKLLG